MALWSEIDRIRKDPKGFRAVAKRLLAYGDELTDWERDFLTSIQSQHDKDEFTNRQSEKLLQIRDDYEVVTKLPRELSVRLVLQQCIEAKLDLSENDEAWIEQRVAESSATIRRKHVGRLMQCGREVHAIDPETD
jgi:hypothetical protein